MQPPKKYLGSKTASGVYQAIISLMPDHDIFIDAFHGSGAIAHHKPPSLKTICLDLNPACLGQDDEAQDISYHNTDAVNYIANYNYVISERVLIYCDPPYVLSTRHKSTKYKHDFTDDDHIRLLKVLKESPYQVLLSGYESSLYDEQLKGWNKTQFQAMTRGGVRTECLWFNYTLEKPFAAKFAGKNFTHRQQIRRKAQRWAKNFKALPPIERLAVLAEMMKETVEKI